jgi:hypothetical protein
MHAFISLNAEDRLKQVFSTVFYSFIHFSEKYGKDFSGDFNLKSNSGALYFLK